MERDLIKGPYKARPNDSTTDPDMEVKYSELFDD